MPTPHDWETPIAEINGVAQTLDFIGEGQEDTSLRESLWLLSRVLKERAKTLEAAFIARKSAKLAPAIAERLN